MVKDVQHLAALAMKLWPGHSTQELENEFEGYIQGDSDAVFIVEEGKDAVGFAHCSLRVDYVSGAENSPAGYLEGIYVDEDHRYEGYARKLVEECEQWARDKGCLDFASDCLLDNLTSIEMHQHLGFREVERTVAFHKKLQED